MYLFATYLNIKNLVLTALVIWVNVRRFVKYFKVCLGQYTPRYRYFASKPGHEKSCCLHMRKQRRRTAQLISAFVSVT